MCKGVAQQGGVNFLRVSGGWVFKNLWGYGGFRGVSNFAFRERFKPSYPPPPLCTCIHVYGFDPKNQNEMKCSVYSSEIIVYLT